MINDNQNIIKNISGVINITGSKIHYLHKKNIIYIFIAYLYK